MSENFILLTANVVFRQLHEKYSLQHDTEATCKTVFSLFLFCFVVTLYCCLLINILVAVAVCRSVWISSRTHTMSAPVVDTLLESTDALTNDNAVTLH